MSNANAASGSLSLPQPDSAAMAHSARLSAAIAAEIEKQQGCIGFDDYMQMALYEPGLGYYSSGIEKLGRKGDFTTAPLVSSLFSFCLAEQCKQVLQSLPNAELLESGAGTGVMARDILLALERQQQLPEQYLILEVSADLKQRQRQTLEEGVPHLLERVRWLDSLPESGFNGVIVANEVLDAIPVKRIRFQQDAIVECCVAYEQEHFCWRDKPVDGTLLTTLQELLATLPESLPIDYCTEIGLNQAAWINSLGQCLDQGVILLIDYGYVRHEYYHPQRINGSLLCHYQHLAHEDPFFYPGLQDISASVDFTAVANDAVTAGLTVAGFTNQANFLIACGLERVMAELMNDDADTLIELAAQAKRLSLPSEMGERFKVLGLCKQFAPDLSGFSFNNQLQRL